MPVCIRAGDEGALAASVNEEDTALSTLVSCGDLACRWDAAIQMWFREATDFSCHVHGRVLRTEDSLAQGKLQ